MSGARGANRSRVGLAALALLLACDGSGEHPPGRILFISMDTVRADVAYDPAVAPNLAALASGGLRFDRCYAASNYTLPSTMSMLTGLAPDEHGVTRLFTTLSPDVPTLAEQLRERGYATYGFHEGTFVDARFGFDRGFLEYREFGLGEVVGEALPEVLELIDSLGDEPWFLFLQTYAAHFPYGGYEHYRATGRGRAVLSERRVAALRRRYPYGAPSRELARREQRLATRLACSAYNQMAETHGHKLGCATESFGPERPDFDAQLSAVRRAYADRVHRIDEAIGRIVAALEQRGQLDDTLIIVTSDHGEAFFEHGLYQHDDVPYDEVMRVPLVIHAPGSGAVPGRRARLASHLDLVPTVLARLGETNATAYAGVDLLGPESAPSRSVFSALLMPAQKPQHALRSVLLRGDHKWIEAAEGEAAGELYDLAVDPDERSNLADEAGDLVSSLRSEAALRSSSVRLRPPHHITSGCCVDDPLVDLEGTAISDEQRAQLEALGYGQ